jgi:branched-subunit amino acid transport protein
VVAVSDLALLVTVAGLTYLSRAAAVVFLPRARGYVLGLVSRVPAPLFASLALFAFVGGEVDLPDASTIAAVVAALLASPKRSLGLTLAAGIAGFVVVELIF